MEFFITNDYKHLLKDLAKYVKTDVSNIDVLEKDNVEYIVDKKNNVLGIIDEHFFNFVDNSYDINNYGDFKNPTEYSKIIFENIDDKPFFDGCIFTTFRDPNSNGLFYRLVYVPSKNENYEHLNSIINNNKLNGFHWSDMVGQYDEIIEFVDEFEYWKHQQ